MSGAFRARGWSRGHSVGRPTDEGGRFDEGADLARGACRRVRPGGGVARTTTGRGDGGHRADLPDTAATGATGETAGIPEFATLEEGVLSVGSCLDYPPFESVKAGDEIGFDIDLTEEIAGRLGLTVEWVRADFDTIFTAVSGDQFDMVAAASTITDEREDVVDFSDPYFNSLQSLTVNTAETPDLTSTDQLGEGDVVGVQKGTTGKARGPRRTWAPGWSSRRSSFPQTRSETWRSGTSSGSSTTRPPQKASSRTCLRSR